MNAPRIPKNHPALFKGETPMKATLEDGEIITVIARKGHDLYRAPGLPGNFGGVADKSMPECCHYFLPLKGGRNLQLFVNVETGLVCIDLVNRGETGGSGILRRTFPEIVGGKGEGRRFKLESLLHHE